MTLVWLKRVCYLRISKIEIHLLNELKIMQYIFEIFSFKLDPLVRDRMNQNLKFITKLLKRRLWILAFFLRKLPSRVKRGIPRKCQLSTHQDCIMNNHTQYYWIIPATKFIWKLFTRNLNFSKILATPICSKLPLDILKKF